jgi:site-specific recombinase XerD
MANLPDDIKLVLGPAEKRLNQRQLLDYETHREDYLEWLYHLGKSPEQAQGYSQSTVKRDAYRVDQFYRWIWSQEDGYTTSVTHTHADDYIDHLAYGDNSNSHKSKCLKALKRHFKWRHHQRGADLWNPKRSFSSEPTQPQNYDEIETSEEAK